MFDVKLKIHIMVWGNAIIYAHRYLDGYGMLPLNS